MSASGTYTFDVEAERAGETAKSGASVSFDYALPLSTPSISSATSKGAGVEELVWSAVTEADSYEVSYSANGTDFVDAGTTSELSLNVSGLNVGTKYTFKVVAVRNTPAAKSDGATIEATATAEMVILSLRSEHFKLFKGLWI
jgi:hypothetical protein